MRWRSATTSGRAAPTMARAFAVRSRVSIATACAVKPRPPTRRAQKLALTYEMAKEARGTRLGAYLRLQPDISDYHAALNEVGVIYASAQIHSNGTAQERQNKPQRRGGRRARLRDRRLRRQGLLDSQLMGLGVGPERRCALDLRRLGRDRHGCLGLAARRCAPDAFGAAPSHAGEHHRPVRDRRSQSR